MTTEDQELQEKMLDDHELRLTALENKKLAFLKTNVTIDEIEVMMEALKAYRKKAKP